MSSLLSGCWTAQVYEKAMLPRQFLYSGYCQLQVTVDQIHGTEVVNEVGGVRSPDIDRVPPVPR